MQLTISVLLGLLPFAVVSDNDWPGYRGDGSATAKAAKVPLEWSKEKNLLWQTTLPGKGPSSPVVVGDTVYITSNSGYKRDRLHVLAFDVASGKQRWERQLWATGGTECHPTTSMAAPTPTADTERVYALFATADLVCFDRLGNLVWYRPLAKEYPGITNQVGMASSPLLAGDALIVPMQNSGETTFCLAVDPKSGKDLWKLPRKREVHWSTPSVMKHNGQTLVLVQDDQALLALDAKTGKEAWRFSGIKPHDIVGPTTLGPDHVVVSGDGVALIKPGANDTTPQLVWKAEKLRLGYCTPIHHQGYLYALTNNGVLNCLDAKDGKQVWQHRLKGTFAACPVLAHDKILLVNEAGTTYVLDPTPKEAKVIATNNLTVPDPMMGTPAVANGRIFLRSDSMLFCVGQKN